MVLSLFLRGGAIDYSSLSQSVKDYIDKHPEILYNATEIKSIITETNNYTNVLDLGAKADGVSDDSTIILNALKSKKSLYLPSGIYKCKHDILVDTDNISLHGDGIGKTIILYEENDIVEEYNHIVEFKANTIDMSGITIKYTSKEKMLPGSKGESNLFSISKCEKNAIIRECSFESYHNNDLTNLAMNAFWLFGFRGNIRNVVIDSCYFVNDCDKDVSGALWANAGNGNTMENIIIKNCIIEKKWA